MFGRASLTLGIGPHSSLFYCVKAMVRPHLKYANSVCCPYKKGDIEIIDKVQKELY